MRIATRGSDLALWQTNWVRDQIRREHGVEVELLIVTTQGDQQPDRPLRAMEGVGFFSSEIEQALLEGKADAAVHSYKDLPTSETPGLTIVAVPERAAPNDWLLIRRDRTDPAAPPWPVAKGARVGTSSARRSAQLLHRRPDLNVTDLRGNVPTRVERLRAGTLDAIVLAQAGLDRLGLDLSDIEVVDLLDSGFLPAAGQGALAIQCRADDQAARSLLGKLTHPPTARCVQAERALSARFEGGCSLTLGCLARTVAAGLELWAVWPRAAGDLRSCRVTADAPETAAKLAYERLTAP